VIRKLWAGKRANANIGVATGFRSGLDVLDVDVKGGTPGLSTLESACARFGALPDTLRSRTPTGGLHFLFRHPGIEVRSATNIFVATFGSGVDIRGDGGFAVVPPSLGAQGTYEWLNHAKVADLPDWIIEETRKRTVTDQQLAAEARVRSTKRWRGGLFDFKYINSNVPIVEVAAKLGLEVEGSSCAHCWRKQNHAHGDEHPSIGFFGNRGRCFICDDERGWSVLNLVMMVQGYQGPRQAAEWIADHFPGVRTIAARPPNGVVTTSSTERPSTDYLVEAGVWAKLGGAEALLWPVFAKNTRGAKGFVKISYPELLRQSGIHSRTTLRQAMRKLCDLGLLEISGGWAGDSLQRCNGYRITLPPPTQVRQSSYWTVQKKEERAEPKVRQSL
jgi:hypothetical protein